MKTSPSNVVLGTNIVLVTAAPTFVFDVEGVIKLATRGHRRVSKHPGVKGHLQDSLARQHDLRMFHQLQAL